MSAELALAKLDDGRTNQRILADEKYRADFRRVEAASIKRRTHLCSAEGKRLLARCFYTFQANLYTVSQIGRVNLSDEEVLKLEKHLRDALDKANREILNKIAHAETLLKNNNIDSVATYDVEPLETEVGVISSLGRRYFELIHKFDALMPMLQTLEIEEVISSDQFARTRSRAKRVVLHLATMSRRLAVGVRVRKDGSARSGAEGADRARPDDPGSLNDAQNLVDRIAQDIAIPAPGIEAQTQGGEPPSPVEVDAEPVRIATADADPVAETQLD